MDSPTERNTYEPKDGDFLVKEFLAIQGNLVSREASVPTIPGLVLEFKVLDHTDTEKTIKIHIHDDVYSLTDFNNHVAVAVMRTLAQQEQEIPKNN